MSIAGVGDGGTSTVSAETVTGWHVLKVEGYSQIKGLRFGNDKPIKSCPFSVGGHNWHIKFFHENLSVALYLDHRPQAYCDFYDDYTPAYIVQAWPTFSVLNPAGGPARRLTTTGLNAWTFQGSRSCQETINKAELESSYLKDDSFRIRCDVTVFKEIRVESTIVESITVPPPNLHHHLGALLSGEFGGDVTFEIGGETFPAHKYMLAARSLVFKAELFGPMKEKATDRVRIDDMEPRVFRAMLHFIYTDTVPEIANGEEMVVMHQHLLVAADRYNMERLRLICEDVLCRHMCTDIAATTLVLAEQHGCPGLKEACFKFLRRPGNLRAVMATDGFQHLNNSCPSLLEEVLAKVAT